jgi:hypothetical protein
MHDLNINLRPYIPPTPAEQAFESLTNQIRIFERALTGSEAVGAMLASFGQSVLLQVHTVSRAGQFVCMEGINSNGDEARLVQHFTQVSLMLTKIKVAPEKPRRPIGFTE